VSNNKKNRLISALHTGIALTLCCVMLSSPAIGNVSLASAALGLSKSTCIADPGQKQELAQFKQAIAAASDINQARKLALAPTDDAINALRNARHIMPFSADLRSAENRLGNARSRIMLASSQAQVVDEFDGMMLAGLDNDRAAHINIGSGGCDYSTGELIAVAIGLVLGVIPGIILLVLLC
jgi:hypothetical protein